MLHFLTTRTSTKRARLSLPWDKAPTPQVKKGGLTPVRKLPLGGSPKDQRTGRERTANTSVRRRKVRLGAINNDPGQNKGRRDESPNREREKRDGWEVLSGGRSGPHQRKKTARGIPLRKVQLFQSNARIY